MKVVLTDRDRILFKGLFEQRVLDVREIAKTYFPNVNLATVGKRLSRLCSVGYLKKSIIIRSNGHYVVYFINKKGVSVLIPFYPYKIEEKSVGSNSIEHDIELFRIRKAVSPLELVTRYFTENMLQSCKGLRDSPIFSAFGDIRSDAALELNYKDKKHFCAIEFETSDKELVRYREKLSDYYSRSEVDSVIYICTSSRLVKNIGKINEEFFQSARSKLYFIGLKEFYQNPNEIISNLLNQ